jgi:methionyl-tRNA formyltransferase
MKIVFMGTPDFAVPCLQALLHSTEHDVAAVFTQPDKPKGRGYKMIPPPVKAAALEANIPVYQPLSLRKGEDAEQALQTLQEIAPDVIVVVAYGQILPKTILDLPRYHCINIHGSLLPAYRGAAPMQMCLLNGETETGVTAMQMAEGLDTGDMLVKASLSIGEDETFASLHDRLAALGAEVLLETLAQLEAGTVNPEPQEEAASSYAGRITKEMSALHFEQPANVLHNIIRGITGFTTLDGKRLKVYASHVIKETMPEDLPVGAVADAQKLVIKCGDGFGLQLLEVQPEGKKRMQTADFLRGKSIPYGTVFGA